MAKGVKGFQLGNKHGLGTRFSTRNQPQNRGRKRSFYGKALKESNGKVEKSEFIFLIRWILELPMVELQELSKRKDIPVWMLEYITALLSDYKLGRIDTLNYAFNLIFGKGGGSISVNNTIHLVNGKRLSKNSKTKR